MGEAKHKKKLLESYSNEEKIIFNLANRIHTRLILGMGVVGLCYYATFLLRAILEKEYKIKSDAIVGYINDGETDHMMSHAWLEYGGKKTDLTLTRVNEPNLTGPLLILDQKFEDRGAAEYTYHLQTNAAGERAEQEGIAAGYGALVKHKKQEHAKMGALAGLPIEQLIDFLNTAPFGTYDEIVKRFDLLKE